MTKKTSSKLNVADGFFSSSLASEPSLELSATPKPASQPSSASISPSMPLTKTSQTASRKKQGRPLSADISEETELIRVSYYMTDEQKHKLQVYAVLNRMNDSEVIRMLIDKHLPDLK